MKAGARKAVVTDEHREEARKLKEIWARTKRPTQAVFGETYDIGGQSAVNNFLNGVSALSMRAAKGFARGLGCEVVEFSPRLAREAADLSALVTPTMHYGGEGFSMTPEPAPQAPRTRPVTIKEALEALGEAIDAADTTDRAGAVAMLKTFVDNPSANADLLPLIVRRLSGEIVVPRIAASGGAK